MRIKSILKKVAASVLAGALLINSGVLTSLPTFAAESSVMGTNNYTAGAKGGVTLTNGNTYKFGGYSWMVAEQGSGYAVLQANKPVTSGPWPGYRLPQFGNNSDYTKNIDGQDISNYDDKTRTLYNTIKSAEKSTSYGKGLYLIGISKLGVETNKFNRKGSQTSGGYRTPFMSSGYSWTGTYYNNMYASSGYRNTAIVINSNTGELFSDSTTYEGTTRYIAPAFNLDTSKVTLSGSDLSIVTFTASTGINATQPVTSLTAGQTKALNQVISGVTYAGGTNAGKSASYKISSNVGTISGTNWTIPSSNKASTATLTITETGSGKNLSTKKTVNITPDVSGLTVTQGTTSVVEGSSTPLSTLFSSVKYSNNANANYSVTVKTENGGSIKGDSYVAPTGLTTNMPITLTIKDNTYNYTIDKNITVVPRPAKEIRVEKNATFRGSLMEGSTTDLATLINVTGVDSGDQDDGVIKSYSMSVDQGELDGTVYTAPKDLNDPITVNVNVTAEGSVEEVNYAGKAASFAVNISIDPNGGNENAVGFDANTWYQYKDSATNIDWMYKLDSNGNIIGLYTESDDISSIIDSGKCLNVPAKVNGRPVTAIGGESEEHPFIPASLQGWTSISFPSSLTVINDYAFAGNTASARITIPATVHAIGLKSFYQSNVTGVSLSEFSGTIGSYAFGSTPALKMLTAKGGSEGMILSTVAFADAALEDVSITGNVTVHKKAFRNNVKLRNINLNGDISLDEYAFTGAEAAQNLNLSGNIAIGAYAFNECTALKNVYLPSGTSLSEYAFNGCTGLESLEADCDLPSHSFENTGNITKIILDAECASIASDWEGNNTQFEGDSEEEVVQSDSYAKQYGYKEFTNPGRTIYALNSNTLYQFRDGETKLSCFGASGTVQLYIPYDKDYNGSENKNGSDVALLGMSLFDNASYNALKNADGATSVMVTPVGSLETLINNHGIKVVAGDDTELAQTGISAHYTGTILTTKDINKEKMTVTKMYGAKEGGTYDADGFYVVRTSEFNEALASEDGVTEEKIAAYEPITATEDDLKTGQTSGTISATVVVFYENEGTVDFFATPVSIRVEEYSAKTYIEEAYGSYDAVAAAFVEMEERIKELEKNLEAANIDSIETLTRELEASRKQYAELVEILSDYVKSNAADSSGFFGTTIDEEGNQTEVVFIEGNAVPYEKTEVTDKNGNAVYSASYDVNGDGEAEEIYFTVRNDGIHITDKDGNDVNADGTPVAEGETGKVYPATLTNMQRQLAAQIDEIRGRLDDCESGIRSIKDHLKDAGIDVDEQEGDSDYEKISNAIDSLSTELNDAQSQAENYQEALKTVYQMLTNENLSAEDTATLTDTLNAINEKISGLHESVATAEQNAADLKEKLNQADGDVTELKKQLEQKEEDINNLKSQVEALSGKADSYLVTAKMANSLFNANLADDASKEQIDEAVKAYVKAKMENDETIKAIQTVIGTTATGQELVDEIENKIKNSGSGDKTIIEKPADYTGYTKDTEVNKNTASYTSGYDKGYENGKNSVNTKNYYNDGYEDGYSDGVNESGSSSKKSGSKSSYKNGYSDGLSAGKKSVNTDSYYNNGYNKGFSEGVASVNNAPANGADYKSGYEAGLAAGKQSVPVTVQNNTAPAAPLNVATGTGSVKKQTKTVVDTPTEENAPDITINAETVSNLPMELKPVLGTVVTKNLPISTDALEEQEASSKLKDLDADTPMVVITNGETSGEVTVEQKDHAYKILAYYKNNLKALEELGGTEIVDASSDADKQVTFEIVSSKDVLPNEEQKAAFAAGNTTDVTFTSGEFEDDALYLVIHESMERENTYDVMLDHPQGGTITMNLPDLSPITIAKVTVGEVEQIESTAVEPENNQPEEIEETEGGNTYTVFAYCLIVVALGLLAVLGVQIKKKGGFRRSR